MEVFLGIPAADGVGIGTAFVIPEPVKRAIPQHRIKIDEVNKGWSRFQTAVQSVSLELSEHLESLSKTDERDKAQREVFETYILMLGDPVFSKEVKDFYEEELYKRRKSMLRACVRRETTIFLSEPRILPIFLVGFWTKCLIFILLILTRFQMVL